MSRNLAIVEKPFLVAFFDVEVYFPKNFNNFSLVINARIGLAFANGVDGFFLFIGTSKMFGRDSAGRQWGHGFLIVQEHKSSTISKLIHVFFHL